MIKTFKKCIYSDAVMIVCFDENDKFLCKTQAKKDRRLFNGLMKLTNKFGYINNPEFQICMNGGLLLDSGIMEKGHIFETLFKNQRQGGTEFHFSS